jgi:hypothetical protein
MRRHHGGSVDNKIGKQAREAPPSPRKGTGPHDRAQVEELEDAEKDIVGKGADPIVVAMALHSFPFVFLDARRGLICVHVGIRSRRSDRGSRR